MVEYLLGTVHHPRVYSFVFVQFCCPVFCCLVVLYTDSNKQNVYIYLAYKEILVIILFVCDVHSAQTVSKLFEG